MSRRKQAHPSRHPDAEEGLTGSLQNGESSASLSEDETGLAAAATDGGSGGNGATGDEHICGHCRAEFLELDVFLEHKRQCGQKPLVVPMPDGTVHPPPDPELESDGEVVDGEGDDAAIRRHHQDLVNNNGKADRSSREGSVDKASDEMDCSGPSDEKDDSDAAAQVAGVVPPQLGSIPGLLNLSALNVNSIYPFPASLPATNVTLEALQNTKVAVAQFAATALANNSNNAAALQELAVLQSTLYTLQQQQMLQLQLIQQLQQQLQISKAKEGGSAMPSGESSHHHQPVTPISTSSSASAVVTPNNSQISSLPTSHAASTSTIYPHTPLNIPKPPTPPTANNGTKPSASPLESLQNSHPNSPIPPPPPPTSMLSSLASSIITNNDPPCPNEPNTLEMLQRRAQEVLDNASQGLLANSLADDLAFRKGKPPNVLSPYDQKSGRNEPFFKHRCRYCGKVFGSDSALQIHIRSHTGERPFKCNVCGSRFTTKGNLKVHFQRHTTKFPHIKMNPHPVPEHLDKFHPPLLSQLGQQGLPPTQQALPPGLPSPHHHHHHHPSGSFPGSFPTSLPLYRLPLSHDLLPQHPKPLNLLASPAASTAASKDQDVPENLSKSTTGNAASRTRSPSPKSEVQVKTEEVAAEDRDPPEYEANNRDGGGSSSVVSREQEQEQEQDQDQAEDEMIREHHHHHHHHQDPEQPHSPMADDCSIDSRFSNEDGLMHIDDDCDISCGDPTEESQDQPENLSKSSPSPSLHLHTSPSHTPRSGAHYPYMSQLSPTGSSCSSGGHMLLQTMSGLISIPTEVDPSKDPAIYTNLLPRPGSTDTAWESLIEVTKTSETSKLQQLVDNIEYKLTDPNQCVICHRVLSCKSALQMHYRTHTGERPFKCKICGRAFTTKGNLKTHMGVHRAKPPMRVLHQCPVCHKKFTNALVLQQHIRLHTGEPTDLTPEQIQAAEVKDFPPSLPMSTSLPPFLPQGFPHPHHPLNNLSNMPTALVKREEQHDNHAKEERSDVKENNNADKTPPVSVSSHSMASLSTSLAALENQVRTINTMASEFSPSSKFGGLRIAEDLSTTKKQSTSCSSAEYVVNGEKSPNPPMSPTSGSEISGEERSERSFTPKSPLQQHQQHHQHVQPHPPPPPPSSSSSFMRTDHSRLSPSTSVHLPPTLGPAPLSSSELGALDLTPRSSASVFSGFGMLPTSPLMSSALSSLTTSVLSSPAFNPMNLPMGPSVRGNTTCNICFKTFACNSALEIHYRSHTKERPFKCTICDRGFSTKGNMKQHMLTHKIRDMPSHLFDTSNKISETKVPPIVSTGAPAPTTNTEVSSSPVSNPNGNDVKPVLSDKGTLSTGASETGIKRSSPEGDGLLPIPKRPAGLPKHMCHVCNKNFSSSSALQIHMRTHTGDKPFKCSICQKAFTTKGNLKHTCPHVGQEEKRKGKKKDSTSHHTRHPKRKFQGLLQNPFLTQYLQQLANLSGNVPSANPAAHSVHMGTHVWNNGTSRRGRRMSLELAPITMNPKDSEFLQRRPDLFYPYLPTPFLNGLQPKLNEISVIQNPNSNNRFHPAALNKISPLHNMSANSDDLGGGGLDHPSAMSHVRASSSPPPFPHRERDRDRDRDRGGDASSPDTSPSPQPNRVGSPDGGENEQSGGSPWLWKMHYEQQAANTKLKEDRPVSPATTHAESFPA